MSDESSWIYDIIPEAQAKAMNAKGEKIKDFMNNGVTVVLSASNQSAIEICQTWQNSLSGDPFAWVRISSFMAGLIETIEQQVFQDVNLTTIVPDGFYRVEYSSEDPNAIWHIIGGFPQPEGFTN